MAMARILPSLMRGEPATSKATISLLSLIRIIRTSLFPFLARANFWPTGSSLTRRSRLFLAPSVSRFLAVSMCPLMVGCLIGGTAGLRSSASSASTQRPSRSRELSKTSRSASVARSARRAMPSPGVAGWRRRATSTSGERAGCSRIFSSTSGGVLGFWATWSRSMGGTPVDSVRVPTSGVMRFLPTARPGPRGGPGTGRPRHRSPPCADPGGPDLP